MTDPTETRALIARVRTTIAPADQPQTLRDLARTADDEPRVDAGMLRREAARLEACDDDATLADYVRVAGSWGARRIAIPIDVAAAALDEAARLRARVTELEAEVAAERATAGHVLFSRRKVLRREGAEAMRERAAALVDLVREREWTPEECAATIRALPLDDDAREDAQGGEA